MIFAQEIDDFPKDARGQSDYSRLELLEVDVGHIELGVNAAATYGCPAEITSASPMTPLGSRSASKHQWHGLLARG
jgi:hypothetical protein